MCYQSKQKLLCGIPTKKINHTHTHIRSNNYISKSFSSRTLFIIKRVPTVRIKKPCRKFSVRISTVRIRWHGYLSFQFTRSQNTSKLILGKNPNRLTCFQNWVPYFYLYWCCYSSSLANHIQLNYVVLTKTGKQSTITLTIESRKNTITPRILHTNVRNTTIYFHFVHYYRFVVCVSYCHQLLHSLYI